MVTPRITGRKKTVRKTVVAARRWFRSMAARRPSPVWMTVTRKENSSVRTSTAALSRMFWPMKRNSR